MIWVRLRQALLSLCYCILLYIALFVCYFVICLLIALPFWWIKAVQYHVPYRRAALGNHTFPSPPQPRRGAAPRWRPNPQVAGDDKINLATDGRRPKRRSVSRDSIRRIWRHLYARKLCAAAAAAAPRSKRTNLLTKLIIYAGVRRSWTEFAQTVCDRTGVPLGQRFHSITCADVHAERDIVHRCKKTFYVFYSGHVFTFFNVFLFCQRFLFLKMLIENTIWNHFRNNGNE